MSTSSATLVFVYGTLKRGCANHDFLADQTFIGEARTAPGFRLYHLGDYPGMIAEPADRTGVSGEVWSVTPEALDRLDSLEGTAQGLYRREPIPLLPPFADQHVESYLYNLSLLGRPEVPDGTWIDV